MSINTRIKIALRKRALAETGNPVRAWPLSRYVDLMRAGAPFSFSRFGDGEWSAVFGKEGKNCDGHEYFPALGNDLRQALLGPLPYFYAMQPRAIKTEGREIRSFLLSHRVRIEWHDSDVFHNANGAGRLYPFVRQLRNMKVVLVGPAYLRAIRETVFDYAHFIEVPHTNCYEKKDSLLAEILEYARSSGPAVFAFSASMTANVLIHDLFPRLGATCWLLDLGSLWDVYAGNNSRLYFEKGDWKKKTRKNLGPATGWSKKNP
jgi:hypothetical protein